MSSSDPQARKFLLTINNPGAEYTHSNIKAILSLKFKTFEFAAMCDEIGNEGHTPHTHIFASFYSAVRVSTIKKNFPSAHIDVVKGTIQENINYLKKEGKWADTEKAETSVQGTYEEIGTRPAENKGKNVLYEELYRLVVEENLTTPEIVRINQDYLPMIDMIDRIRTMHLQDVYKNEYRDVSVTYVFGVTGAGKSRGVLDKHGPGNVYRVTDYKHPFDGYKNEEVIAFDEFRSQISISDMLHYLDIYPIQLPARYSNKFASYTKVYIISNEPLEKQYEDDRTSKDSETWQAFLRRINEVWEYKEKFKCTIYKSIDEYNASRSAFRPISKEEEHHLPYADND